MSDVGVVSTFEVSKSDRMIELPFLLGASFTVCGWVAITLTCVYLGRFDLRTLLISADAAVLFTPVLVRFLRGTFDLFEPILMAVFALSGMMIGRPLSDLLFGNHFEHAYDIGPTYNAALLLVLAANLAFVMGYELPLGRMLVRRAPRASLEFNTRVAILWAIAISIIGCLVFSIFLQSNGGLAFFFRLSAGRTGTSSNPFASTSAYITNAIGLLVPGASILFALWLCRRKLIFLISSAVVLTPYLFLMLGGGARSGVVGVLFGLPLMWYFYRQKRPPLVFLMVAGLAAAFFFSVQRDARFEVGADKGQALQEALSDPVTTILNLFRSDDDEMFDVIAQELAVMPQWVPYSPGSTIRDILVRATPRSLFPNDTKPKEAGTVFFSTMEPARARYSAAGTAPSIIGNFYLDSGAVTSIFYMFVMGVLLSAVWAYFLANQHSLILLIAFSTVPAAVLTTARGDLPSILASVPYGLLPVFLLFVLQRLRLRSTHVSALASHS